MLKWVLENHNVLSEKGLGFGRKFTIFSPVFHHRICVPCMTAYPVYFVGTPFCNKTFYFSLILIKLFNIANPDSRKNAEEIYDINPRIQCFASGEILPPKRDNIPNSYSLT